MPDYGTTIVGSIECKDRYYVPVDCIERSVNSRLARTQKRLEAAENSVKNARNYEAQLRAEGRVQAIETQLVFWQQMIDLLDRAKGRPIIGIDR